ncbi:MAG: DUF1800 domain-containing protein [Bacteroidota bacterium]
MTTNTVTTGKGRTGHPVRTAAFSDIQHLAFRAGFGADPAWIAAQSKRPRREVVEDYFRRSLRVKPLLGIKDPTKGRPNKKVGFLKLGVLFAKSRGQLRKLNLSWLDKMAEDEGQLREKMTLFWHDHFATHTPLAFLMQVQNNTLRQHALGNFREMVHAISKDPAMLIYLNNQQNKKDAPNENFAREVMELFTLGEGHYTEQDIKEAARAFTGWTVNRSGRFEFKKDEHDFGVKAFRGKKGAFEGEEIIDIILEDPQVARFIAGKIYTYFVHPEPHTKRIDELAQVFFQSRYDISAMMKHLFMADWFYESENKGALIKSPVELLVQLKRILGMDLRNRQLQLAGQDALGQVLFFPPNVSGWPHHTQWIDSTTLLLRMRIPLMIFGIDDFDIEVKPQYEDTGAPEKLPRFLQAKITWEPLLKHFRRQPLDQLVESILAGLLPGSYTHIDQQVLKDFCDQSSPEAFIKTLVIRTLALPEFQLT